jgi:hypothetical protein
LLTFFEVDITLALLLDFFLAVVFELFLEVAEVFGKALIFVPLILVFLIEEFDRLLELLDLV